MEKKDQQQQERFYWNLAFIIFLLFIASIIALYSGQTQATVPDNYVLQQVVWFIIGALIVALAMFLEPDQYKKLGMGFLCGWCTFAHRPPFRTGKYCSGNQRCQKLVQNS